MRFVSTALVMMAIALVMLAMTFIITPSGPLCWRLGCRATGWRPFCLPNRSLYVRNRRPLECYLELQAWDDGSWKQKRFLLWLG
jgi:hypothetical protein